MLKILGFNTNITILLVSSLTATFTILGPLFHHRPNQSLRHPLLLLQRTQLINLLPNGQAISEILLGLHPKELIVIKTELYILRNCKKLAFISTHTFT